ncbi:MAG: hypothetical protein OEV85_10145 [Candidatus Thorarchaeota archaeon]|nr:hypothetical protein [Candidatus Thorarchaeota archaeon]
MTDDYVWKDMVDGNSSFPEFERLLEKDARSVYHEDNLIDARFGIGMLLAVIGLTIILLGSSLSSFISLGLALITLGLLIMIATIMMNQSKQRKYKFYGLSRSLISEAIMYIDIQISQSKDSESSVRSDEIPQFSSSEIVSKRDKFLLFLRSTKGLITWPSETINPIEETLRINREKLPSFLTCLIVIFFVLAIATYFLLISGILLVVAIGLILLICTIQYPFTILQFLRKNLHVFKGEWISDVPRSEQIQLEESLNEIFSRLQSEFLYPLRFFVVREYPSLKYTGRMKTSSSLIRLKEAILYPLSSIQNEKLP